MSEGSDAPRGRFIAPWETSAGGPALSQNSEYFAVVWINASNPHPLPQDSKQYLRSFRVGTAAITAAITFAGVFAISRVLDNFGQSGPGAGVLVITAIPNIVLPFFIVAQTLLVHLHGRASWRSMCIPRWRGCSMDIDRPFRRGVCARCSWSGMLGWAVSCFVLRHKRLRVNSS